MIPIENSFNMYPYYYQMQFPMIPPYFLYPPLQHAELQATDALLQKNCLPQQPNTPELYITASEASAQPVAECKKEEITQIKISIGSVTPGLPENNTQITKLKKAKNEHQKEGRNANSNLLRMFFRRLHQRLLSEPEIIQRIIRRNHLKIKAAKFLEWLELNDVEHRNYVRLPDMKALFTGKRGSREQAKVMRVLLKEFLQKEAMLCYLTSKKIKRESMPYNFYSIRNVLADIYNAKA